MKKWSPNWLVTLLVGLMYQGSAVAQNVTLPWGQSADMIAWEEFVQVTAPSGNPAVHKVEFETWASDDDIYVKSPAKWPNITAPKVLQPTALGLSHLKGGVHVLVVAPEDDCTAPEGRPQQPDNKGGDGAADGSGFPANACIGEEVRRNWASFQYIVSNGLDSRTGLKKAFAAGLKVSLPADSIEFKGDWASVADVATWLKIDANSVRQSYYTSFTEIKGNKTEVALLGFHVSSKQIERWVWSDFEGARNPGRCDVIGCRDSFGATAPVVAPNPKPYQSYGACQKSSAVIAMMQNATIDPIWSNYCLKGTQIDFVDATNGKAIKLGNSIIEPLNAGVPIKRSSCITCHGYASFDKDGNPNRAPLKELLISPIGPVDTNQMAGYLANDFIWGVILPKVKN